jgi:hypothetical protein
MEGSTLVELRWEGPFRWPGIALAGDESVRLLEETPVGKMSGIYLWTVEHAGGFLICGSGRTKRPFLEVFREHTRAYRAGTYNVLDVASLRNGVRTKIWSGFFWKKETPIERRNEFQSRSAEIGYAVEELLSSYRIFVACPLPTRRLLERIQAALMENLYNAGAPVCNIPDVGGALAPRRGGEPALQVRSVCELRVHGLPPAFDV